jgi:dephospho-CoA kinase
MIILGLTGSIGMGKSTAARHLRRLGIPIHDTDVVVHRLLTKGGAAVPLIEESFPEAVVGGTVERARLATRVFGDDDALKRLEGILHPLVRREERRFLQDARRRRRRLVALDIPLLFETGADARVDYVAVLSCPAFLQEQRVMARHGMTLDKLQAIRRRQMPDGEKRRRADFVIPTGASRRLSWRRLSAVVCALGHARPRRRYRPA